MRILTLLLACLLGLSSMAHADMARWVVNKEKSTLQFSGSQGGKPFHGEFKKFTPDIEFSPTMLSDSKKMGTSHVKVTIDMSSCTTGDKVYDGSLPGPEWFNIAKFPEASFETTSILATGVTDKTGITNYEAKGNLTILGISKEITLPFSLKDEGGETHAFGEILLKRLDFGIGKQADSKAEWVSDDIKVRFDIYAHP